MKGEKKYSSSAVTDIHPHPWHFCKCDSNRYHQSSFCLHRKASVKTRVHILSLLWFFFVYFCSALFTFLNHLHSIVYGLAFIIILPTFCFKTSYSLASVSWGFGSGTLIFLQKDYYYFIKYYFNFLMFYQNHIYQMIIFFLLKILGQGVPWQRCG